MGFWDFMTGGRAVQSVISAPALASPFAPQNDLTTAIVSDWFGQPGEDGTITVTPEIALRVPEVNRALQAHTALVAPLKFEKYADGERTAQQPAWTTGSDSGVPPFLRWTGCVRDLYLHGWACLGARLGEDGLPDDLVHIPRTLWEVDTDTGRIKIDEAIPSAYRTPILIPLGSNGLLVDGVDSVRQARKLELARQARLDTPPAAVELHLTDPRFDDDETGERADLARAYAENRRKYAVAVTPSYVEVKDHQNDAVDLFEGGMNSLRLQLAMHAGVPASFLEAGKEGGSNGQMTYTNENGKASELWVFGSSRFAYAIIGRLSMDDVVGPGAEIRADMADFMVPAPAQVSAESPVDPDDAPPLPIPTRLQESLNV